MHEGMKRGRKEGRNGGRNEQTNVRTKEELTDTRKGRNRRNARKE
jgi:hypothetical protein